MNPDLALLALRVVVGVAATIDSLRRLSILSDPQPARLWVLLAIAVELGGGTIALAGVGGPIGPGMLAEILVVVYITATSPPGVWEGGAGWSDFPALRAMPTISSGPWHLCLAAAALAIAFVGGGTWTLDRVAGLTYPDLFRNAWLGLLGVSALLVLAARVVVTSNTIGRGG